MTEVAKPQGKKNEMINKDEKQQDVRTSNILAAKAVADAVRTSLGPRGMDKMIEQEKGEVLITNDGATILSQMQVLHPAARMLVDLSKAQDVEAGDGTTSVVVLAGSLLGATMSLLDMSIHPSIIADAFDKCADKACEVLQRMAIPIDIQDKESLIDTAVTSLSSKVVCSNSTLLAPIAVDSVLSVSDVDNHTVDLRDIHIVKQIGGTVDDSELVNGLILGYPSATGPMGITEVKKAKIGIVQFHLSAPKTDIDNKVIVNDYTQMDRLLREERSYILDICKKIKKTGCNVLLVQKSILRDAVNELSLHFLAKLKILVVANIERDQIEFIARTLNCRPVAHIDSFTEDKLGYADLVMESSLEGDKNKVIKITGIKNQGNTTSILLRGSNKLVLDEAERSLHDALCVIRCIVKKRYMLVGGGAPETEVYTEFMKWCKTLKGADGYIARAFAEALEIIPYTLAENAGLNPIKIVTELRKEHALGNTYAGINVKKGTISDMKELKVLQPLLVSTTAIQQATEYVRMILKIDDMVATFK
ncbi:hypothetical protein WA158_001499 [Blastocystis sp. Blastoise]